MKRLLNTLYVTSPNRYLSLDGENVVILEEQKEIGRVPLHNLQGIVTFGYTGASPALMGACAQRNIDLSFMSGNGRFLARVTGEVKGNVTLRKQQYKISEDKTESVRIARNFIFGKVYNTRWILERAARDYPLRLDAEKLKEKSNILYHSLQDIRSCESADRLLGLEGEAASVYFSVFDQLILQQKEKIRRDYRFEKASDSHAGAETIADRRKQLWTTSVVGKKIGASDRNRTGDNHVGNVMLYQLSYTRLIVQQIYNNALSYFCKFRHDKKTGFFCKIRCFIRGFVNPGACFRGRRHFYRKRSRLFLWHGTLKKTSLALLFHQLSPD